MRMRRNSCQPVATDLSIYYTFCQRRLLMCEVICVKVEVEPEVTLSTT